MVVVQRSVVCGVRCAFQSGPAYSGQAMSCLVLLCLIRSSVQCTLYSAREKYHQHVLWTIIVVKKKVSVAA